MTLADPEFWMKFGQLSGAFSPRNAVCAADQTANSLQIYLQAFALGDSQLPQFELVPLSRQTLLFLRRTPA